MWRLALALGLVAPLLGGCKKSGGDGGAIPEDLRISVEVDGRGLGAIDAKKLEALEPDFSDGGRSAWKLSKLLGPEYARPNTILEVIDAEGTKTQFVDPANRQDGREPVLAVNKKGDILVALMKDNEPFPSFHGRGGSRGRSGDPDPRIRGVVRFRLHQKGMGRPAGRRPVPPVSVDVIVAGQDPVTWTGRDFRKVDTIGMAGEGGEGERDVWPLREMVKTLVGPKARVTKVVGENGKAIELSEADWTSEERVPVLRINRRGLLKFQWARKDLSPMTQEEVRGLAEIHVAP